MSDYRNISARYEADRGGIVSIKCEGDPSSIEFFLPPEEFPELYEKGPVALGSLRVSTQTSEELKSTQDVQIEKAALHLSLKVHNPYDHDIVVQSVQMPLLMNQYFRNGNAFIYEQCVLRHASLIGEGAYVYWSTPGGTGPVLLLLADQGTPVRHFTLHKEYAFGSFVRTFEGLYCLNLVDDAITLKPSQVLQFGFQLTFADSVGSLPQVLCTMGGLAVTALPGMVVPIDETARFLLDTKWLVASVYSHDGDVITQKAAGEYEVHFAGCGERLVHISWAQGGETVLPFFSTQPLEQMIDQQAAFIAKNHFETDKDDPCYHGLLAWDLPATRRVNHSYNPYANWMAGGSDEIGLVSAVYLAEKNRYRPVAEEIAVLAAFARDFVEERLTEQPGWRVHRMVPWFKMFEPWAGYGADDVWRAFNYVHVVNIYFDLYKIASRYPWPGLDKASLYLEKAYEYARAMFAYWMFPDGKGATEFGNMGEMTIALDLEPALRSEGLVSQADTLRDLLDTKSDFFAARKYPFGSEMTYDTTAFEAVYAYAKRAGDSGLMGKSVTASHSNRGTQPVWHKYQVDIRQQGDSSWNVSYMTQLGAWPFFDAIMCGETRDTWLAIHAYASYVAGWSIFNSEGCWDSHPDNRGSAIWVYSDWAMQRPGASRGLGMKMTGEGPLGFFGALRCAASLIVSHPRMGLISLGCFCEEDEDNLTIIPRDGLGLRVCDIDHGRAVILDGDRMTQVVFGHDLWILHIVSTIPGDHALTISVRGLPEGIRAIRVDGKADFLLMPAQNGFLAATLRISNQSSTCSFVKDN